MGLLARAPLHPLLLAAYAVLFVYAANVDELTARELWAPLAVALGAAAVVLAACALLYRDLRRGALLASAVVAAFAFFGHLGAGLDEDVVTETMQLGAWAVFIVGVGVVATRLRGRLAALTSALNAFALVLVGLALLTIVPAEVTRAGQPAAASANAEPTPGITRLPERDIYFLVLDRYGSDWSLTQRFGLESDLDESLAELGFEVVPGARATYRATDFSLAAMLGMDTLDDLTARVGRASSDRTPAREKLGEHAVGRFLQAAGYRYYHLGAWYQPTRTNPIADEVLVWGRTTELEQVLRDATVLPALERLAGTVEDDAFRNRHREEALFAFRQLARLADTPGRKFVFAHILLPHPPYGFDAQGGIVRKATEQAAMAEGRESELFAQQLAFTNARVLEVVRALLDRPLEERPIIILTGDEGPMLCGNVDCIDGTPETYGIRFGTLRAYYLPDGGIDIPPDDSGVNIFRRLFREEFGADLPDLPERSYDWPDNDHLYDFRDITDELPLPGAGGDG